MSEKLLQAVIMRRALFELGHQIALPNDTSFYSWESDLLTINKSGYVNEYECKINRGDFARDCKKYKFQYNFNRGGPNYFWYVTLNFDIVCPDFAGWLKVVYVEKQSRYDVSVMKTAPLRHKEKPTDRQINMAAHLLSIKLMKEYGRFISKPTLEQVRK